MSFLKLSTCVWYSAEVEEEEEGGAVGGGWVGQWEEEEEGGMMVRGVVGGGGGWDSGRWRRVRDWWCTTVIPSSDILCTIPAFISDFLT